MDSSGNVFSPRAQELPSIPSPSSRDWTKGHFRFYASRIDVLLSIDLTFEASCLASLAFKSYPRTMSVTMDSNSCCLIVLSIDGQNYSLIPLFGCESCHTRNF